MCQKKRKKKKRKGKKGKKFRAWGKTGERKLDRVSDRYKMEVED